VLNERWENCGNNENGNGRNTRKDVIVISYNRNPLRPGSEELLSHV
jgi:hypothetical protein